MARVKTDDQIFKQAKTKLGEVIGKTDDPATLVSLVGALVKMKDVEIKANDSGYGGALRDTGEGEGDPE